MSKSIDASELRTLAADISKAGMKAIPKVEKVVSKGALNIKNGMRDEMSKSPSWRKVTPSISYDLTSRPNGVEAEIGPKHSGSGNLANIAYFGTSKGGGGTVDLMKPMDEEAPRFEKALGDVLDGLI